MSASSTSIATPTATKADVLANPVEVPDSKLAAAMDKVAAGPVVPVQKTVMTLQEKQFAYVEWLRKQGTPENLVTTQLLIAIAHPEAMDVMDTVSTPSGAMTRFGFIPDGTYIEPAFERIIREYSRLVDKGTNPVTAYQAVTSRNGLIAAWHKTAFQNFMTKFVAGLAEMDEYTEPMEYAEGSDGFMYPVKVKPTDYSGVAMKYGDKIFIFGGAIQGKLCAIVGKKLSVELPKKAQKRYDTEDAYIEFLENPRKAVELAHKFGVTILETFSNPAWVESNVVIRGEGHECDPISCYRDGFNEKGEAVKKAKFHVLEYRIRVDKATRLASDNKL